MKPIMKKVPKLSGISMTLQDLIDYSEDIEFYVEDNKNNGFHWIYQPDNIVTVKFKGKVINIKDISIDMEEHK